MEKAIVIYDAFRDNIAVRSRKGLFFGFIHVIMAIIFSSDILTLFPPNSH